MCTYSVWLAGARTACIVRFCVHTAGNSRRGGIVSEMAKHNRWSGIVDWYTLRARYVFVYDLGSSLAGLKKSILGGKVFWNQVINPLIFFFGFSFFRDLYFYECSFLTKAAFSLAHRIILSSAITPAC